MKYDCNTVSHVKEVVLAWGGRVKAFGLLSILVVSSHTLFYNDQTVNPLDYETILAHQFPH